MTAHCQGQNFPHHSTTAADTHLWSLPGRNWRKVIFGSHFWLVFNTSCRRIKPSSDSYSNVKADQCKKLRTTSTIAYETDRILRSDLKPACCCVEPDRSLMARACAGSLLTAAIERSALVNTLRTGLLNCLNARSRSLTFRHRASCI